MLTLEEGNEEDGLPREVPNQSDGPFGGNEGETGKIEDMVGAKKADPRESLCFKLLLHGPTATDQLRLAYGDRHSIFPSLPFKKAGEL